MIDAQEIRAMTQWDLAALGLEQVAYIKPVADENGTVRYAIHAADGSEMGVSDDHELAFAAVRQHDMEPVSVH